MIIKNNEHKKSRQSTTNVYFKLNTSAMLIYFLNLLTSLHYFRVYEFTIVRDLEYHKGLNRVFGMNESAFF